MHRIKIYLFWGLLISAPFFAIFGYRFIPFFALICVATGEINLGRELKKMKEISKNLMNKCPNMLDETTFGEEKERHLLISTSEKEMFLLAPGIFVPQIMHLLREYQLDYCASSGWLQSLLLINIPLSLIFFNPIAIVLTVSLLIYVLMFSKNSYSFLPADGVEKRLIKLLSDKSGWTAKTYHFTDEAFIKYNSELFASICKKIDS